MEEVDQISFRTLNYKIDRTLLHKGKTYLFFGGTAYLGLNTHPEMIRLYKEGLDRYGLNVGTSRNNNVQLETYAQAEKYLADRFDYEDAMVVSSGFLASQLALRALSHDMKVYYAPNVHPALWPQEVSPATSKEFEEWVAETIAGINQSLPQRVAVASDTFSSIQPSCYDFSPFLDIQEDKEIYLILDDSHGFGVFKNPSISRLQEQGGLHIHVLAVGSLAKGLGIDAGVIMGSAAVIKRLRKSPVFAGASPPSPAAMYALINSSSICAMQWQKLQERMKWFENRIPSGYHAIPGFPVYCFDDPGLYDRLLEHGIIISSFSYPRLSDPLLNRIVINSLHTKEDIEKLAEAISSA